MNSSSDENALPPMPPTPGRDLATRALLATACTQERVGAVLGISRRSVGRTLALDGAAIVRDEEVVTIARTCLAESESRGSTEEERLLRLLVCGQAFAIHLDLPNSTGMRSVLRSSGW